MSAEVSFTKRAAAELSRCFNGLTVNRAGNSGSTTGSVASSTNSSKKSTTSSTGSASGPSTSSSTHSTSSTASSSSFLLNQEVIVHNNSSSSKYSKDRKDHTIESSVSETTSLLSKKSHHPSSGQSNSTTTTNKSSAITIMRDGISIPNSVQTLITKANTSLSPFKHHSLGNRQQQQNDSSSNGHHHHFAKGCKSTCSSSKNENSQCPSTPSRRPPPPVHRKTSIARRKNFLLSLQKPSQLEDLVRDFNFLHEFFSYFSSKERTVLAQVCIYWRDILYNDSHFWKGLVMVINCNELKRVGRTPSPPPFLTGHQSADSATQPQNTTLTSNNNNNNLISITSNSLQNRRKSSSTSNSSSATPPLSQSQQHPLLLDGSDSVRNNLYVSIEQRGFDSVCLNGATDSDIIDFASKVSPSVMRKISSGCLRTSCVTDKGLEIFLASLNQSLKHLELSGCNEITDSGLWTGLVPNLESLIITDCINIADETVAAITQVLPGLKELTLQAYHVTDSAMSYFGPTALRVNLRVLHLEHCWEIGNQGILSIAHGLPNLTSLSLSGCSKVTDDAIEVIAEQLRHLSCLNLSWCSRITDASLEYIACDLADSLRELILDRCVHVTDIGLGYAATMGRLTHLSLRWCPQIRDFGIQTLCSMKSLKSLSLSGCPQLTVSGLSCLVQIHSLTEVELTNCPGATIELVRYLTEHLPPSTTIIA